MEALYSGNNITTSGFLKEGLFLLALSDSQISNLEPAPKSYQLWIDIVFCSLFGIQIAFNAYSLIKTMRENFDQIRRGMPISNGQKISLTVVLLLTVCLSRKLPNRIHPFKYSKNALNSVSSCTA